MKSLLKIVGALAALAALSCPYCFAKKTPREMATVVERESLTTPYYWQVDGRVSLTCSGNTCSGYYTQPQAGVQQIQGAVIRLRRPDSSIIVAQCVAKVDVLSSLAVALDAAAANDPNSPTVYRDCRIPAPDSIVQVEMHGDKVKLFVHDEWSRHGFSETYLVLGVLRPAVLLELRGTPVQ
jgi:hypothetical protein